MSLYGLPRLDDAAGVKNERPLASHHRLRPDDDPRLHALPKAQGLPTAYSGHGRDGLQALHGAPELSGSSNIGCVAGRQPQTNPRRGSGAHGLSAVGLELPRGAA